MTRLRVVSVGSLPPEWGGSRRGGVATFHATLLEGLRSRPEVEVKGVIGSEPPAGPAPVPVLAPAPGQNRREFLGEALTRWHPDIILLHHFATHNGLLLPELAPRIPLVGIAHSWHTVTFAPDGAGGSARERVTRAMAGLRAIVFDSEHSRAEGIRLRFEYPPIQATIHPPVDPVFATPLAVDGPREGAVFLGTIEPRKRPEALLDALALTPGLRLTIVGRGPEAQRVHERVEGLGLGDRVSIEPDVPGPGASARLLALLSGAEVMCVPSSSETFGIAYIEALACGTPVVGFGPTVSEIAGVMGIDVGEALERGSPAEIAAAIARVRATSWDRELLRERTLEVFSQGRVARRYAQLLRSAGEG